MSNIAIKVENLNKIYPLYNKPIDRLKEAIHPFRKKYHHDFTALNNVSFEIKKGETVGIIGKNGSGKSTLLKILTGVLTPTSGNVKVNGKVAALLELGAGFNPELTGVENIFLNGSLMGYTKEEMDQKLDAIIEFADIGEFINQPVRMYSSGMFARLAFAVAINVDPDILIVDEALSVGDVFFQAKCYNYFKKLQSKGTTILFVTHSLDVVLRICTSAFCLSSGKLIAIGSTNTVVDAYKKHETSNEPNTLPADDSTATLSASYQKNPNIDDYGTKEVTIVDFAILDENKTAQVNFYQGQNVELVVKFKTHNRIKNLICAFAIKTIDGIEVLGSNTNILHTDMSNYLTPGVGTICFKFPLALQNNNYTLSLGLTYFDDSENLKVYHRLYNIISFTISNVYGGTGLYAPPIEASIN